jgi:hypothetical protein
LNFSPKRQNKSFVKGGKVAFRPGVDLREMLNNLRCEKGK